MADYCLPDATHLGHAQLRVSNLARSLVFYRDLLGFQEIDRQGATAHLSPSPDRPAVITLTEAPGARPKPARTTGLYHVAIRVPDRPNLGRLLRRLAEQSWPLHGVADHLVSEAIYLPDPDGNGLELYIDRPRPTWQWDGGQVVMATDPLDVDDLLAQAGNGVWTGIAPATDLGHVHLHVADLLQAEAFYCDLLGFSVTQRSYPGALFVSAGGYHHHVGLNIWAGRGAPPAPPDTVGLIAFSVRLPDADAWQAAVNRLRAAHVPLEDETATSILVRDPSRNGVLLEIESGAG
jgi:catechol 2,3-dioxygenase